MKNKTTKNNKGFSLIELIISVTILSIGALALMRVFSVTARLNQKSSDRERFQFLADQTMEQVKATDLDQVFDTVYTTASGSSSGISSISFGGIEYNYNHEAVQVQGTTAQQPSFVFYKANKQTAAGPEPLLTTSNKNYGVYVRIRTDAQQPEGDLPDLYANNYTMPLIYDLQSSATQLTLQDDDLETNQAIVQQLLKQLSDAVKTDGAEGNISSTQAKDLIHRYMYVELNDAGGAELSATVSDIYTTDTYAQANLATTISAVKNAHGIKGTSIASRVKSIHEPEAIKTLTYERYRNPFVILLPEYAADDLAPEKIVIAGGTVSKELLIYTNASSVVGSRTSVEILGADDTGRAGNLILIKNQSGYSGTDLAGGTLDTTGGEVLPKQNVVYDIRVDVVPLEEDGTLNLSTAAEKAVMTMESTKTEDSDKN